MKLRNIILCLIVTLCYGCSGGSKPTNEMYPMVERFDNWTEKVIVDGCEYGKFNCGDSYYVYTHLGTCKQCWAKMEQLTGKRLNAERE